jgi:hypothetical protein
MGFSTTLELPLRENTDYCVKIPPLLLVHKAVTTLVMGGANGKITITGDERPAHRSN